jgi:hypothetical protein
MFEGENRWSADDARCARFRNFLQEADRIGCERRKLLAEIETALKGSENERLSGCLRLYRSLAEQLKKAAAGDGCEFEPGEVEYAVAFIARLPRGARVYVEEFVEREWRFVFGDAPKHASRRLSRVTPGRRFRVRPLFLV